MENNYAKLIEAANDMVKHAEMVIPISMINAGKYLQAVELIGELTDALVTVGLQNRNLRHDLELTKRDYEANLEELLKAAESIKALSETIYVEVNGLRYIVDPRLKEPAVGVYDPELKEVLE